MAQTGLCPGCMRELGKAAAKTQEQKSGGQKMSAPGRHGQQGQRADTARCPYCGFCPSEYQQNPRCLPPDTILAGKYLVGKVLGEGGFGITYMGYDLNMKTRVAIKEYFPVELVTRDTTRRRAGGGGTAFGGSGSGNAAPSASASGGSVPSAGGVSFSSGGSDRVISLSGEKSETYQQGLKKYVDEARNVSQFADIPGIVSVKDFFYENNTAYIVMEYIEGISLKEYLKQKGGKLSEEESLAILRPVLEALEKVHAAGIVHRDISPDNIMLTFAEEGKTGAGQSGVSAVYGNISAVKIIDFGAARMTSKNDQKSLTIILKHGYAPEEQYRSHGEQGAWTDVYALCAVLYRMLTGKVPEPAMDRLFSDGLKPPEELGVKVSPAVSEAIMRGLAVKKEDRIRSVRELMDALYARKRLKKSGKKLQSSMFRVSIAAGIAACAFLVVAGTVLIKQITGEGQKNRESAAEASENTGTTDNLAETSGQAKNGQEEVEPGNGEEVTADEVVVSLDETEEELGEQIVFYEPQNSISISPGTASRLTLFCKSDGTVSARGSNENGECEVEDWRNVAAVSAGNGCALGLRTDGTVLFTGDESWGFGETAQWSQITSLCAGYDTVLGLTQEGTVVTAGNKEEARLIAEETAGWENIRAIALDYGMAVGLQEDGTVLFAGEKPECGSLSGWDDVADLETNGSLLIGRCEDGTVRAVSLTVDTSEYMEKQIQELTELSDIMQIRTGSSWQAVGVREDGTVYYPSDFPEQITKTLDEWQGMQAVTNRASNYGAGEIYGLKKDGTIVWTFPGNGNAGLSDMKNLKWVQLVGWQSEDIAACTEDGRLLAYGMLNEASALWRHDMLQPGEEPAQIAGNAVVLTDGRLVLEGRTIADDVLQAAELWNGSVNFQFSCGYAVLKKDGNVDIYTEGDLRQPDLEMYRYYHDSVWGADEWTDMVQLVGWGVQTVYGLKSDGTVWRTSVTENGGGSMMLPAGQKVVQLSVGIGGDVLGIGEDGTIEILMGMSEETGMLQVESWKDITQLAMGECHTVGLRADGTVVAAGQNYAGQCDVEDWKDIVYIAAGRTCTLGITADGELKMAGSLY